MAPFYGNFGVVLKAYAYMLRLGREGLIRVTENAVLAANYLRKSLDDMIEVPYDRTCMHEFVASADRQSHNGVRALDIAKALLDRGYHAPTIYFPLIVKECLMFEPTETECKDTLDAFVADLRGDSGPGRKPTPKPCAPRRSPCRWAAWTKPAPPAPW